MQRGKPSAPHPDATIEEVQNFITAYYLYNGLDQSRARAKAEKLDDVNGDALYRMSREDFVKIFEANGGPLYDIIQYGTWGYYRKAAGGITSSLSYLCSFSPLQGLVGGKSSQRTPKTETSSPQLYVSDSPQQFSSYTKSAPTNPSSTLHFAPRSSKYETRLLLPRQNGSCSDADIILAEGHGGTSARQHGNVVSVRRHNYQDAFVEH